MTEVRAVDLPEASIVAARQQVWVKERPSHSHPWVDRDGGNAGNSFIQTLLDQRRATVPRVGYGDPP